jgi:hypothetical protein
MRGVRDAGSLLNFGGRARNGPVVIAWIRLGARIENKGAFSETIEWQGRGRRFVCGDTWWMSWLTERWPFLESRECSEGFLYIYKWNISSPIGEAARIGGGAIKVTKELIVT